jgi:hypothetical protein
MGFNSAFKGLIPNAFATGMEDNTFTLCRRTILGLIFGEIYE